MSKVIITEKWMNAEKASFKESSNPLTGKRELILESLIVPFNKISRNGVLYGKESIERTHKMLEGRPLMFNHVIEGVNAMPRGEWISTWTDAEGMKGRARVFDTDYNKDLIEYLQNASSPRVSLQITGDAEQKKNKEGNYYKQANINDWLEASIVPVPGFDAAKSSFAVAMTEAFGNNEEIVEEAIKPGKYKSKGGEEVVVHSVKGNKAIISGNDSKEKEIDVDALKAILVNESTEIGFFEQLNNVRNNLKEE